MKKNEIKILIAEDELIIALDIKNMLKKSSYEICSIVSSGEEAIKKASEEKPNLILMDIMLKGSINGIEAAEVILKEHNIPVIFLTAIADDETLEKAKITEPFGYIIKPYDERTLHAAVEMAIYKHNTEKELKFKTAELEEEKKKADSLIHNILPADIAAELKVKGKVDPHHYRMATVLLTEFCDFSAIALSHSPQELMRELNDIFNNFDIITERFGLEKLKTINDSYMICGGVPQECNDHAIKVVETALEMQRFIRKKNESSLISWKLKIGINSGPVIAGIVGINKFSYDIWGHTVNMASRIASSCLPGTINISSSTYKLVSKFFNCVYRGKLHYKGKRGIDTYSINSNDITESFDKSLINIKDGRNLKIKI
jgi:class 3 adenylate cyclase